MHGFYLQVLWGALITVKLAVSALVLGIFLGLAGAFAESISFKWLRYLVIGCIFIVRGLPELLVLFFIYFGLSIALSFLFKQYVEVSAFVAGVIALSLIFASYASQVFRGAFLAIPTEQIEAGKALGLTAWQIFKFIQLPQAWRYALPGLSNLWLVLLKDTAIVSLIGISDMMGQAKMAANTMHQPFHFYFLAALIYLCITTVSQKILTIITLKVNHDPC
ncbi:MAG: ABC transporter permease subunit [Gammaproteobacteria bacterium]|nr:ABC transporter permease subunit [Gammaproteobacteria bacterium]